MCKCQSLSNLHICKIKPKTNKVTFWIWPYTHFVYAWNLAYIQAVLADTAYVRPYIRVDVHYTDVYVTTLG